MRNDGGSLNGGARQKGYILALNIAVLAVMLVGATYMGQRLSLARNLALAEQQRVTGELAIASARAQVLYLLTTATRSRYGLGALPDRAVALDGRTYRIGKDVLVSLQDARGLISLNSSSLDGVGRVRLERLLATYNLDPATITGLIDNILDYRDTDDLRRINGAEKEEYALAGKKEAIRNADLLTPTEVARVMGVSGNAALWGEDPLANHINTLRVSLFNPNTADWRAIVAATGTTEEMAKNLVNTRRSGETPDISGMVFTGAINNPFGQGGAVSLFPSETIIVTLQYVGSPSGVKMSVKHTPASANSPWLIQYSYKVPLPRLMKPVEEISELPAPSTLRDFITPYQVQLPF